MKQILMKQHLEIFTFYLDDYLLSFKKLVFFLSISLSLVFNRKWFIFQYQMLLNFVTPGLDEMLDSMTAEVHMCLVMVVMETAIALQGLMLILAT